MAGENLGDPPQLYTWRHYGLPDYAPIGARLPLVENSLTQMSLGPITCGAAIVSNGNVTVARASVSASGVGRAILTPDNIGFYIPLRWVGRLKFNGVEATPNAVHMPVDDVHYHIQGQARDLAGCILPRTRFVEAVAALSGVDPDELVLGEGSLELAPDASRLVRTRLLAILENGHSAGRLDSSGCAPFDLESEVFDLMLDAYLSARPESMRRSGRARHPARIVRAAEERFAQAGAEPVSLADLCLAAGVSKSALYIAFQSWCNEPPIAYFRKRRLMQVRSRLLDCRPQRGAVKAAALAAGLTELGRFSRDYRQLFGESPSVTLKRSIDLPSEKPDRVQSHDDFGLRPSQAHKNATSTQ